MLEKTAKHLEESSKGDSLMDDALKAQELIKFAFPEKEHGSKERAQERAWRKLGLKTLRRARAIWNREARVIHSWEMDRLREAELEQARKEYVGARNRIEELTQRANERHARIHSAGSGSPE